MLGRNRFGLLGKIALVGVLFTGLSWVSNQKKEQTELMIRRTEADIAYSQHLTENGVAKDYIVDNDRARAVRVGAAVALDVINLFNPLKNTFNELYGKGEK